MRQHVRALIFSFGVVLIVTGTPRFGWAQASDSWVAKPAPSYVNRSASVVANGKIYLFGSDDGSGVTSSHSRVYDPVAKTWTTLAPMPMLVTAPAAAVVNGLIYVIGGHNPSTGVLYTPSPNQVYDASRDCWSGTICWPATFKSPTTARTFATAQAVGSTIYLIGGTNSGSLTFNVNEAYDPLTDTWTTKTAMPTARGAMASAVLGSKIYVLGGYIDNAGTTTTVNEAYDATLES